MTRSLRITLFSLVAVIAIVVGVAVSKFSREKGGNIASADKELMQRCGIILFETPRIFRSIGLETTEGKPFDVEDLKGQWTFLYFGFTFCPDICPATLARLNQLDHLLKVYDKNVATRIRYMMVSVDPKRDSIDKLKDYLKFFNSSFIGVTGEVQYMDALTRQLNVVYSTVDDTGADNYQMEHSAQVIIINPQGHYHGYIRPDFEVDKLVPAIKTMHRLYGNAHEEV